MVIHINDIMAIPDTNNCASKHVPYCYLIVNISIYIFFFTENTISNFEVIQSLTDITLHY